MAINDRNKHGNRFSHTVSRVRKASRLTVIACAALALLAVIACAESSISEPTTTTGQESLAAVPPTSEVPEPVPPTSTPIPVVVPSPTAETSPKPTVTKSPPPTKTAVPRPVGTPTTVPNTAIPATAVLTPTSTPAPTPTPSPTPAPPPHHYLTVEEVETALLDLGCNSWTGVSIGDTTYYRACETEEQYQIHVMGAPNTGPTPTPTSTPPPHHYLTVEEVETALLDLPCDSWSHFSIGETYYYRACANDDGYLIHIMGAPTNTSGELCTFEGEPNVRFTVAPTDLSQIRSIVPSGSPSGGTIANHSYIHNKSTPASQSGRVPVYAVADSVLNSIAYYISRGGGTNFYQLGFDVSCEIGYMYDHLLEVAPKIAAVAPATSSESSASHSIDSTILFEAGELIGYVGEGSWDFGATDTTRLNQLVNPDRYIKRYWGDRHSACPYDYYDEPLKSQFYALFGDPGGTLFPTLRCTPTRDLLGSAAGQWFDALDFDTGTHAIAIAMLPGDTVEISTDSGIIRVRSDSPRWLDPELLTASHCYADQGTWYYLEIQAEGMQMAFATGTGTCPNSLPENATTYYR